MKVNIEQNNKGINQDIDVTLQPEGTSRFRLNALPETKEGDLGFMPNEAGNTSCYQLTDNYVPIGQIPILEDKTVIFSVNTASGRSEIGLVQNCQYTVLINSTCLDFAVTNQIRGIFRVREGCNINIYFTDFLNPWRVIDIDNLNQYLNAGETQTTANADGLGWDCNSFKLFRNYNQTNIDMEVFNTGGNTNVGMYQFTYQYLDDDFNPQPWNTPSNPIPIVKDSLNEYTGLDGDVTGTVTNKSIQITIDNLDTRYSYVRLGLIISDFGTGFNSNAYILEELPIENTSAVYLFSGIDPNKTQNTDLESFTFLPPDYYTGKDLTQIDNSLVLAYPKARDIDYVPFIQAALEVQTIYKIHDVFAESTGTTSYGNRFPNSYYYNKSLMRDEVYPFGVVFVFNDGTETPAFHIPGRAADKLHDGTTIDITNVIAWETDTLSTYNLHNRADANSFFSDMTEGVWDKVKYPSTNPNTIEPNIIDSNQIDANGDIYRWKLFNTAVRTSANWVTDPSTANSEYRVEGELAYWESQDYTYPETTDCNGTLIYGDLAGQKVRYHKMPDTTLEPHYYGYDTLANPHTDGFAYIRPLTLEFSNINIPAAYADEISGYRIVRVERNDFNKSVLDKGILSHNKFLVDNDNPELKYIYQNSAYDVNIEQTFNGRPTTSEISDITGEPDAYVRNTVLSFHSPRTKIEKDTLSGDYIKIERTLTDTQDAINYFYDTRDGNTRVYYDELSDRNFCIGGDRTLHYSSTGRLSRSYIPISVTNPDRNYTNRIVNKQSYIPANSGANSGNLTYNFYNQCQNETFVLELNSSFSSNIEIYEAPFVSSTAALGQGFIAPDGYADALATLGTDICDGSEIRVQPTNHYVSLKRYSPNQYNGIHQLIYSCPGLFTDASNTTCEYSNGDCFINDWGFKKWIDLKDGFTDPCPIDSAERLTIRSITRFWCESEINMELRDHDNTAEFHFEACAVSTDTKFNLPKVYYPYYYNESKGNVVDFLEPEIAWIDGRFGTVRNWYNYNRDFGIENTVRSFFPLPINYDYCNECLVKYPHRLANSNKAYQEERADNYRIFLPNNYRDIPGETGNINEVFIKDNKLFIHTTQSLWYQQVKPQQIKTDQATLYVGTGEFWEIPPNELVTSLNGYAGCQNQVGTINTPFGYFFPSERERKVFLFNDKLSEISNEGLRNWFETNLPFHLTEVELLALGITTDNPSNPNAVGYTVAYDKRHRRIIFSKRDYLPLAISGLQINSSERNWRYQGEVVLPYDRPDLFENKSWTISYSPEGNYWISWHSYLPFFMWNDQNNFYTHTSDAGATGWKHNQEIESNTSNFQKFYELTYPYINEIIFNKQAIAVNTFPVISWYSINSEYDSTTGQWVEVNNSFDEAVIYNNNQSTGELTLINQTQPFQTVTAGNQSLIKRTERLWSINRYRDYAIGTPVFTTNWTDLQSQYYIDKVVNTANIDLAKSPFETEKFRDEYLACRLIYNNENNTKLLTKFIFDTQKVSPR